MAVLGTNVEGGLLLDKIVEGAMASVVHLVPTIGV